MKQTRRSHPVLDKVPVPEELRASWRSWTLLRLCCGFEAMAEPYVVSRLLFGGRSVPRKNGWPAWLRDRSDRSAKSVRVFPDETIETAK